MAEGTVGQILVNSILPPDLRVSEPITKKTIDKILMGVADKHPDRYAEISQKLLNLGAMVATRSPMSMLHFSDFEPSRVNDEYAKRIETEVLNILQNPNLSEKQKNEQIIELTSKYDDIVKQKIMEEQERKGSTLLRYVRSGARGNDLQFRRIVGGDMLYVDYKSRPIPIPITSSYAKGLTAPEFWAAAYGARKGWMTSNLGPAPAGYLAKQLTNAASRIIVTATDANVEPPLPKGLPTSVDDPGNVNAFLAVPAGGYPRNTLLTPKVLADLKAKGINDIVVRSVLAGVNNTDGVLARDVGLMEGGRLLTPGDAIGVIAAQSIGEPITQMAIGAKHTGGVKAQHFADINVLSRILEVPKIFPGGAVHATETGSVTKIEPNPAGGSFIYVGDTPHYAGPQMEIKVKPGDSVEAGDMLTDGIPNPSKIVAYKGLGEGRKFLAEYLTDWYKQSGFNVTRRNFEVVISALLNHVQLTDEFKGFLPGEIVNYNWLERNWEPREGSKASKPDQALGKYIEYPVLHYTIGTPITPSVIDTLKKYGIQQIIVHEEPPPFQPIMLSARSVLDYDPEWVHRFLGGVQGQRRSLQAAVAEAQSAPWYGSSFLPTLLAGTEFGTNWPKNFIQQQQKSKQS